MTVDGSKDFVARKNGLENAIIGGLFLCHNLGEAKSHLVNLNVSDFSSTENMEVMRSMKDLVSRDILPDLITISQDFINRSLIERIPRSVLIAYTDDVYTSVTLSSYIPILLELNARIRFKIKVDSLDVLNVPYDTLLQSVESLDKDLLSAVAVGDKLITPDMMVERRKYDIEEYLSTPQVLTGYASLDKELTYGFAPSMISTVASRTSHGKSALKANLTIRMCKFGYGVYNVNTEQRNFVEQNRLDAIMLHTPLTEIIKMRQWDKEDPRFAKLVANTGHIAQRWNYYLTDNTEMTVSLVEKNIDGIRSSGKRLDVVFIDLFDRLSDVNMDSPAAVASKLKQLDSIAKRYRVHICNLAQIHRLDPKANRGMVPRLQDMKWSGAFEEMSRLVLLLHRPGMYASDPASDNRMQVIVAKQSDGPSGESFGPFLAFNKDYLSLEETLEGAQTKVADSPVGITNLDFTKKPNSDGDESVPLNQLLQNQSKKL